MVQVFERVMRKVCGWRSQVVEQGVLRVETLLFLSICIGLFLAGGGFFLGLSCSAWPMWLGFGGVFGFAWVCDWRRALGFLGMAGVIWVLTAWTFSYTGTDSIAYHLPMQRLLHGGWNPVFDSSLESFRALVAPWGCSAYHTLFLPKVTSLSGALVARATGLFVADAFLGYLLILALWRVSWRFAVGTWGCSQLMACGFALALTGSTKITSFLAGQVDYTTYAAFLVAIFSLMRWRQTHLFGDLLLAGLGVALCMLAKSTGLLCGGLGCVIALFWVRDRQTLGWGLVAVGVFVCVVGASPLLTAWVRYGSPVYPEMTFNSAVEVVDITADFTGNSDALSMGYVARSVQAWFSERLACWGSGWVQGKAHFVPQFEVCGGVGGFGFGFRVLMWLSVAALLLARRTPVTWLVIFLFVTAHLAPLKYIGYGRYFPQMWAIPFLALYQVVYVPRWRWGAQMWRWVQRGALCGILVVAAPVVLRTLAYQGRQWRLEAERQRRFAEMRQLSAVWRVETQRGMVPYTLVERLRAAGIAVVSAPEAPRCLLKDDLWLVREPSEWEAIAVLERRVPICNSPRELLTFPWGEVLRHLPGPVWRAE